MGQAQTSQTDTPKRRQILGGARAAFLELGYEGASMGEIARRAGVSKGTLYNYFAEKRELFAAFVREECEEQARRVFDLSTRPEDIEGTLHRIASNYVEFLDSPFAQGIFRVAVAEAPRFPELGRAFYESGPDLGMRRLAQFLAGVVAIGKLDIDDVDLAASQFTELCRSDLFYKRLLGLRERVTAEDIARIADGAVRVFMRAYRAG